jgi:uncharacterized protein (TIGR02001 family)
MKRSTRVSLGILFLLAASAALPHPSLQAQSFSLGADIVSRYIWRGTDFGESASIQPALTFSYEGLQVGSWASYAVDPSAAGVNEHDLWASYTFSTEHAGSFGAGVTDYYFPNAGAAFFDFDGDGAGAHWIEPFVSYTGPSSFPLSLYGGMFVHNDPDNSIYLQATYPFAVDGVTLALTAAASGGESALYGTDKFGIVMTGLTASRALPITESFSLPLYVSYIVNPYREKSILVFGVRL